MNYVYRVTREDTYHEFWHQPLVREVTRRSALALVLSSKEYPRYKITKIERAPIGEYEEITENMI